MIEKTKRLAKKLAERASAGDVYALKGGLGSGKTTFTRFFVEALGFESRVQSPTFVVLRKYQKNEGPIRVVNHFDLYRLQNPSDLFEIDFEEIISEPDSIALIEWPGLVMGLLPEGSKLLSFKYISENKD